MHDEAAFQAALDADPADGLTRQVFADWLDERGDPRAGGYRALGLLGRQPHPVDKYGQTWWWDETCIDTTFPGNHLSPRWLDAIGRHRPTSPLSRFLLSRREADDDAARAWAVLTDAERAAILGAAGVCRAE